MRQWSRQNGAHHRDLDQRVDFSDCPTRPWRGWLLVCTIPLAVLGPGSLIVEALLLSPGPPTPLAGGAFADRHTPVALLFVLALLAVPLLLGMSARALVEVWQRQIRGRILLAVLGLTLAYGVAPIGMQRVLEALGARALVHIAERARPMVKALHEYTADHGEPPPSLAALVPDYLPAVPRTGLRGYPAFEYEREPLIEINWFAEDFCTPGWELRVPRLAGDDDRRFFSWPRPALVEERYGAGVLEVDGWYYLRRTVF